MLSSFLLHYSITRALLSSWTLIVSFESTNTWSSFEIVAFCPPRTLTWLFMEVIWDCKFEFWSRKTPLDCFNASDSFFMQAILLSIAWHLTWRSLIDAYSSQFLTLVSWIWFWRVWLAAHWVSIRPLTVSIFACVAVILAANETISASNSLSIVSCFSTSAVLCVRQAFKSSILLSKHSFWLSQQLTWTCKSWSSLLLRLLATCKSWISMELLWLPS